MTRSHERVLVFFVGLLLLGVVLAIVLFRFKSSEWIVYVALRTALGLAAAGFVVFVPGFLQLDWSGIVKASGALAAFAMVFLINPPAPPQPLPSPSSDTSLRHQGKLGDLYNFMQADPSQSAFRFELGDENRDELRRFKVAPEIVGSSTVDLFQKLCNRYEDCLRCEPEPMGITNNVTIRWRTTFASLPAQCRLNVAALK